MLPGVPCAAAHMALSLLSSIEYEMSGSAALSLSARSRSAPEPPAHQGLIPHSDAQPRLCACVPASVRVAGGGPRP